MWDISHILKLRCKCGQIFMLEKLLNSGLILIQTRTEFMVEITQKFRLISHVEKLNPQFG